MKKGILLYALMLLIATSHLAGAFKVDQQLIKLKEDRTRARTNWIDLGLKPWAEMLIGSSVAIPLAWSKLYLPFKCAKSCL